MHIGDDRQWAAGSSFGAVLWGAVAALWWLILENDLFDSAAHCRSLQPWFLFREPLLTTFVHGCATLAAALSLAAKNSGKPRDAVDIMIDVIILT